MRRSLLLIALVLVSCRREETPAPAPTRTQPPPVAAAPAPKPKSEHTYRHAVEWFNQTKGFRFTARGAGFDVTGAMVRPTPGAERVRFRDNGRSFQGRAERSGIVWYRLDERGATPQWIKEIPPAYADQLYQRATIYFDPAKVEGEAQRTERGFRFTDSNTGDRHEITLDPAGRITLIDVSGTRPFSMSITQHDEVVNIDAPLE